MSAFKGKERSAGKKRPADEGWRTRDIKWYGTQTPVFSPCLCFQATWHLPSSVCPHFTSWSLSPPRGTRSSLRLARENSPKLGQLPLDYQASKVQGITGCPNSSKNPERFLLSYYPSCRTQESVSQQISQFTWSISVYLSKLLGKFCA